MASQKLGIPTMMNISVRRFWPYIVGGGLLILVVAVTFLARSRASAAQHSVDGEPAPKALIEAVRNGYGFEPDKKESDLSAAERAVEMRDLEWNAKASFISLASEGVEREATVAKLVTEWTRCFKASEVTFADDRKARMLEKLAHRLWALSRPDPSAYETMCEQDAGGQWADPYTTNGQLVSFYKLVLDKPLAAGVSRRRLLDAVWEGHKKYGMRIAEAGIGPSGAIFVCEKIRSLEQARARGLFASKESRLANAYWISNGFRFGIRFVSPKVSLQELVASSPSVDMVFAHVIIRGNDGRAASLESNWFWDPDLGDWQLDLFQTSECKSMYVVW